MSISIGFWGSNIIVFRSGSVRIWRRFIPKVSVLEFYYPYVECIFIEIL